MAKQAARRYPYAYPVVFDYAVRAIPLAGSKYQVRSADPSNGLVTISATMNFLTWGENLTMFVRSETPEWTRVELVVAMKFGLVDWGQRSRDILEVFGAIDSVLPGGQDAVVPSTVAAPEPAPAPPPAARPVAPAAGWHPDPARRHELRYWDGGAWTEHVSDAGVVGSDPLG